MELGRAWLDDELSPEDQDELFAMLHKSDKSCWLCTEVLLYTDEIFSITVSAVQVTESGLIYPPLVTSDGANLLWAPHLFCFSCMEDTMEEHREAITDVPPIEDMYAVLECDMCESGIRDGETISVICYGELHLSHRNPNGEENTSKFEPMDPNPTVLCISCTDYMSRAVLDELWPWPLKQFNECEEGTFARCWRYGCSAQGDCGSCVENLNE